MRHLRDFRSLPLLALLILIFFSCTTKNAKNEQVRPLPNILFIPVDDLRPEFGAYGDAFVKTPNMDRLARQGVTFMRAYCQQAVCNPSRASLLTGLRPDSIQVWDLKTDFRDNVPDVVTLPQYFKQQGYTSIALGKIFHNNDPDTISWSITPENIEGFPFDPDAVYANEENLEIQQMKIQQLKAEGRSRIDQLGHWYVKANATENADVDDDAYYDGAQTTRAIEILQELKSEGRPFFLSVGYYRPHLPFNAPKKYWDLYDRSEIPLAENQFIPEGSPAYLVHGEAELRGYSDSHDLPLPNEEPWDEQRQREIKHGYYASVSYTDAQIGRLIDELERLGLAENTIVVLWGDHGWKLGEHNGWCKQTNYEIDTRVPLIISGAGVKAKGQHSNALTEFVDIYPTLCEMANFPVSDHLQGTSLVPLLSDPDQEWKTAAYSQFLLGRFGRTTTVEGEQMGYAIRTDRYRYVEWYRWIKEEKRAGSLLVNELFDHQIDPQENINIAADPEHKDLVKALSQQLKKGWRYSKPQGKNESVKESSNLRIISHNVWYGFTKEPERKESWIAWMTGQHADIVSLQELNEYTHEKLAEDAKSYGHAYSVLLKEEGFPTGITSRFPIEDVQRVTQGFHHGLLRVRIKDIYYYVIHLHPSNWETRKSEINQILKDIKTLPANSKVILAGDFNTFSPLDSIYYSHGRLGPFFKERDLMYEENNLNKGELDYTVIQDVLDYGLVDLEASLRNSAYKFPGSFPTLIEKEGEHGDQRRLDYIFASKNLAIQVTRAEIITSDTALILSDHLPVVVDFELK